MKYMSILRESTPEKYTCPFEILLFNYLNDGYEIRVALLDRNDKLVIIVVKDVKE